MPTEESGYSPVELKAEVKLDATPSLLELAKNAANKDPLTAFCLLLLFVWVLVATALDKFFDYRLKRQRQQQKHEFDMRRYELKSNNGKKDK